MATLRSLLASSKSSSSSGWGQSGSSGWGSSSSTWGGKRNSSYVSLPTFGKKRSSSQATADAIMARTKGKKNSHSGSSFLGSVMKVAEFAPDVASNLVTDLVDTAENLPSGLYKTATTNPIDTAKAVGADYGRRYGPLFHGQFGKFASEVAKHPLAPLLDVATVATLGAGTAAKAGLLSGELETTGLRASRALDQSVTLDKTTGRLHFPTTEHQAPVEVNLPRNPATRQVAKAGYALKRMLPENVPVVGERSTAKRNLGQQYLHDVAGKDSGARQAITKEYKNKYGEAATESIQNYATSMAQGGILGKPTQLWKDAVLAGRPAFQINNFVGNHFMYHLAQGLHQAGAIKSLDLARRGELNRAYDKFAKGTESTYGHTEAGVGEGTYRKLVNRAYNLQGKDELILRKASFRQAALGNAEIKQAYRQYIGKNMSDSQALEYALSDVLKGPNGRAISREINQKIEDTLGNYSHYNKFEAQLKKAVPFYGWNRHSTRFLYATARDRPEQLLALHQLGKIGAQFHNDTGWQGTPDFMRGYLSIGGHTIDTAPLNPIKGATDTLKLGRELVKGNIQTEGTDIGSSINPLVSAGIQGLTGKNLLTGAPVPRAAGGLLGSVINQTTAGLPQVRLAGQALPGNVKTQLGIGGPSRSDPHHFLTPTGRLKAKFKDQPLGPDGLPVEPTGTHMLNPTFQSQLYTFLGVPDRGKVNREVARTVEKKIETQKSNSKGFHAAKKRAKKPKGFKAIAQSTTRSGGWGASSGSWGG